MYNLLLVEDNETLGYALKEYLELKGFQLRWAKNGDEGQKYFEKYPTDLCILDVMMPGQDGFTLAKTIKQKAKRTPLIFLTARALKVDKLKGFDVGADDYIVKPVDEEELVARINAVLNRSVRKKEVTEVINLGEYTFNFTEQKLIHPQGNRLLTEREAQLLLLLCECKGHLLSRSNVLKSLWQQNDYFTRRSMDVFISRLRKYLSADSNIEIQNVYGSGFILSIN